MKFVEFVSCVTLLVLICAHLCSSVVKTPFHARRHRLPRTVVRGLFSLDKLPLAVRHNVEDMPARPDIERLYDEHAQPLHAFLLNLTRAEADTRDLLQDLFIKLARDENLLRGVREERAFLIRLAHNAAIDLIRRRATRDKTRENFASDILSPFAPASDPDEATFRNELAAALADLPPDQRAVAHLKLWEKMTFEQIAAALEVSPNTAASRYRYALDKLRARLRPLYEEIR